MSTYNYFDFSELSEKLYSNNLSYIEKERLLGISISKNKIKIMVQF